MRAKWKLLKESFFVENGGKRSINRRRAGITGGAFVVIFAVLAALLSREEDRTFYTQESRQSDPALSQPDAGPTAASGVVDLLKKGSQELAQNKRLEEARRRGASSIKYFAPQIVGVGSKGQKDIKAGARLLGFLLTSIDTREPSIVSVLLPHGGVSDSGVEIEKNSILIGQYSYRGNGDKVSMGFSRLDTPDGDSIKIGALALDAADYTAGVRGTIFSDGSLKVAATLGLTMASSMTDVLTEREAMGNSFGPAQAKPTMKNALLQGISHSAQDQASRTSEEINESPDYVVIPKGKEVIIQLTEDFKK